MWDKNANGIFQKIKGLLENSLLKPSEVLKQK